MPKWLLFAFLAATGTSTVLNFIGMKWWVFRKDINVD
jgi:putative flippase GtrA